MIHRIYFFAGLIALLLAVPALAQVRVTPKSAKGGPEKQGEPWAEVPEDVNTWDPTSLSDLRMSLQHALAELAPLDRAVLVLRHLEDLSVAETAERLRLTPGAVKMYRWKDM